METAKLSLLGLFEESPLRSSSLKRWDEGLFVCDFVCYPDPASHLMPSGYLVSPNFLHRLIKSEFVPD